MDCSPLTGATISSMSSPALPPIVPITAAAQADGVSTVVCDVRTYFDDRNGVDVFAEGHIPGARHLDLNEALAGTPSAGIGNHPLPEPSDFAAALSSVGISADTRVLAYDDAGGMIAGRLVWMLRCLNQEAALLDGGFQAWTGEVEQGPVEVAAADCPARSFPADATVDADEVDTFAASGGVVVDVRSPDAFTSDEHPEFTTGHIAGAINAPFTDNLVDGSYRPLAELSNEYEALGFNNDTIYYCGSGVSACNTMLAAEAAGLGRGRLYVASWSGYTTRP